MSFFPAPRTVFSCIPVSFNPDPAEGYCSMLEKLASALGRNDEQPNVALAEELVASASRSDIREIVEGLHHAETAVVNDCIKVLYEIGYRKPALIAEHTDEFAALLGSRNNRLVWGAMTALATIAPVNPDAVYANIDRILKAYEKGSVITIDNSISVLAGLVGSKPDCEKKLLPILLHHLESCRPKEVGQHAERMFVCITLRTGEAFAAVLRKRYGALTAAQKKRLDRLLKKIGQ